MVRCGTHRGIAGAGALRGIREGRRLIRRCRERINTLVEGESADHVVFAAQRTSDALDLAIKGVARHWQRTRRGRGDGTGHDGDGSQLGAAAVRGAGGRWGEADPAELSIR